MYVIQRSHYLPSFVIALCILLGGCAMKVAPGGGPKDITPAVVTSVDPVSGTTSIKGRIITFEFDDYVDRSIRNAITVLPNARFSTSYGGDELEVGFEEPLDTNTTYTVTIGTEWTDIRGNKPTQAFTTVFSTGERIDTGSIEGAVHGASLTNVVLFCYQRADTLPALFSPRTTVPKFRLPVGSSGTFVLKGLPDGLYRVIVVRDENRNGLLDNTEDFVVSPSDISITNGVAPNVALLLGRAIDRDAPVIARARAVTRQLITLQFSESVVPVSSWHDAISLVDSDGALIPIAAMWLEKQPGDNLLVRLRSDLDTSRYIVSLAPRSIRDSSGVISADTVGRIAVRGVLAADTSSLRIALVTPPDSSRSVRTDTPVVVRFTDAVDTTNSQLTILHSSLQGAVSVSATWTDPTTLQLRPTNPRSIKSWYQTVVTFNNVRSYSGAQLRDTLLKHSLFTEERQTEPGSVSGVVIDTFGLAPSHGKLHLRFINSSKFVAMSVPVLPGVQFDVPSLPVGQYTTDVFVDLNGNGVYDHGDHTPFTRGEQWWTSLTTIEVRSRWTVEAVRVYFGSPSTK